MFRRHWAIFCALAMFVLCGDSRVHSAGDDAKAAKVDRQGDKLPDGVLARLGTIRWRHGDSITFLAFPNADTLLTVSREGGRLWNRATGKEIRRFDLPPDKGLALPQPGIAVAPIAFGRGPGARVALTPDGKIFAAVANNAVQLWDVDTGKEIRQLKGPANGIADLLFSPDGKALAIVASDRGIHLVKTENGEEIRQIRPTMPKGPVRIVAVANGSSENVGLAFSHDGKILASVEVEITQQKTAVYLKLTDLETGKEVRKTEINDGVTSIAFSPDGKFLAHGSGAKVLLCEADTGKEIRTLKVGANGVTTLAFSADSKALAARGDDQVVRLWDTTTGKSMHELGEPVYQAAGRNNFFIFGVSAGAETRNLAFSRDGKTVGVAGGQSPRFFNVSTGKEQPLAGGHRSAVSALAITPDGKIMISRGADRIIRRWNARTGEELSQFPEPIGTVGVAISPDGKLIAFAKADNTIRIHSTETGKELHKSKGHRNGVAVLAFSADSKTVASRGSNDNTIHLFDLVKGGEVRAIAIPLEGQPNVGNAVFFTNVGISVAQALAFSPDGAFIAASAGGSTGPTNMIRVWDVASGKETRQLKLPPQRGINGLAYSPDGRLLAVDHTNGTVSLWEIASGTECALLGVPVGAEPSTKDEVLVRGRAVRASATIASLPTRVIPSPSRPMASSSRPVVRAMRSASGRSPSPRKPAASKGTPPTSPHSPSGPMARPSPPAASTPAFSFGMPRA